MLKLSSALINQPVLSLRTGRPVGLAIGPIIDPNNLSIAGLYCQDPHKPKHPLVLLAQDVREWIPQGFAVNDYDVLTEPDELVRLKKVMDMEFTLIGKPVYTQSKRRIGKVNDYSVDASSFQVQKLYVGQSIFKNLTGAALLVDRNQIIEITSKRIIIRDPLQGVRQPAPSAANA